MILQQTIVKWFFQSKRICDWCIHLCISIRISFRGVHVNMPFAFQIHHCGAYKIERKMNWNRRKTEINIRTPYIIYVVTLGADCHNGVHPKNILLLLYILNWIIDGRGIIFSTCTSTTWWLLFSARKRCD